MSIKAQSYPVSYYCSMYSTSNNITKKTKFLSQFKVKRIKLNKVKKFLLYLIFYNVSMSDVIYTESE